jgi:hypothetical protein
VPEIDIGPFDRLHCRHQDQQSNQVAILASRRGAAVGV